MGSKKLTQYDPIIAPDLDLDDIIGVLNGGKWRRTTVRDLLTALGVPKSVNGKAGDVILSTDDLSDAGKANKFVDEAEKAKLAKIKTNGASGRFLAEDGQYYEGTETPPVLTDDATYFTL